MVTLRGVLQQSSMSTPILLAASSSSTVSDSGKVQLVPKPNTTSPVWKYFALKIDEKGKVKNDEKVVCQLCSKEVVAKGNNTMNLIAHHRVHHPLQYTDYQRLQKERTDKVSKKGGGKGNDLYMCQLTLSWLCLPRNIYAFQHLVLHQKGYLAHQVTLCLRNWSCLKPHKVNMLIFLAHNL